MKKSKIKNKNFIKKSSLCRAVGVFLLASSLSIAAMNTDYSVNPESESAFAAGVIPTASQWSQFLGAVASTSDPYGFYDPKMETLITRSVTPDGFSYSVVPGQEDTLIYGMSDANLQCYYNWLQNEQLSSEKGIGKTEVENRMMTLPCLCPRLGLPTPSEPVPGEPVAGGGW